MKIEVNINAREFEKINYIMGIAERSLDNASDDTLRDNYLTDADRIAFKKFRRKLVQAFTNAHK